MGATGDPDLDSALEELRRELQWIRDRLGECFVAPMQVVRMRLDLASSKGRSRLGLVMRALCELKDGHVPTLVLDTAEIPRGAQRW